MLVQLLYSVLLYLTNSIVQYFVTAKMSTPMEALFRTGVYLEFTKKELVLSLVLSHSDDQLKDLRIELFDIAKSAGLAHSKDSLVRRLKRVVACIG